MQRVIANTLWADVQAAAKNAPYRKAAIAYVTNELIEFRKGDVLIADASDHAIRCGATSATLLRRLNGRGVEIYSCNQLHAKVLLFGGTAVIGSANMSTSSKDKLVEAAVLTDHVSLVSGAA